MKFQLGPISFEATRPKIKKQVSDHLWQSEFDWNGTVFFGELVLVVKPGNNIKEMILNEYDISSGRFILGGQIYEGTPDQLKDTLKKECKSNNILFSGTVSFSGYQHKSKMESIAHARYFLVNKIEANIPIEGRWNDRLFQGKKEDVRKELTEYISSLPMVVDEYDATIGKSELGLHKIGTVCSLDFKKIVAKKLANWAIAWMGDH